MTAAEVKRWAFNPQPPPRRPSDLRRYIAKVERAREQAKKQR